jgi:site-specific DNA recombinase
MLTLPAPRIALYERHSINNQTVLSVTDQFASCMKIASGVGGAVVATYHDSSHSGRRLDRPGLRKFLGDVANGKVEIVVCASLDRLARDPADLAVIRQKLLDHGVALYTASEGRIDGAKIAMAGGLPC